MKVAVIGCGTIANAAHIPAYMKNPEAEIKYFCDIIPERAEKAVKDYGCGTAITDYHVALNDPEVQAVSVCTPNYMHCQISCDAMRAGKDVLCEKPDWRRSWRGGVVNDTLYAGFTHLWLPSAPEAARSFSPTPNSA